MINGIKALLSDEWGGSLWRYALYAAVVAVFGRALYKAWQVWGFGLSDLERFTSISFINFSLSDIFNL